MSNPYTIPAQQHAAGINSAMSMLVAYGVKQEHAEIAIRAYEAEIKPSRAEMISALGGLVNRLTELVDSGDCGFWSPDEEETIVIARALLKLAGAV